MSQSARYAERPHDARKYSIHGGNVAPIHGTVNASRYVGWRSPGRAGRASSAAAASAALSSADVGDGEDGARALIRSFHVAWTVAAAAVAGAAVGAAGAAAVPLRCVLYVCGPTVYRSVRACTRSRKLRKWFDEWWCKKPWTFSFISGVIIHIATCSALKTTLASTRISKKDARQERLHRRRRPCRDERWRRLCTFGSSSESLLSRLVVGNNGVGHAAGRELRPMALLRRRSSGRRHVASSGGRCWRTSRSFRRPRAPAAAAAAAAAGRAPAREAAAPQPPSSRRRCLSRKHASGLPVRRCHVERVLARPCSSVVRAEALHALGRRFEPCHGY